MKILLVSLILFLNGALHSLACNTTEYMIIENKNDSYPGLALRTRFRCDGIRCLYHSDCQSEICLKVDNENRADVEGICSAKRLINDGRCSMTVSDIRKTPNLFENKITMNRCEYVSCHFDEECQTGLVCHDRRYCLNSTLSNSLISKSASVCNYSTQYYSRDADTKFVEVTRSINRCRGALCESTSDCSGSL